MQTKTNKQTALITGASSGIGHELAVQLAKSEVKVLLVGRSRDKLEALVSQINKINGEASVLVTDLQYETQRKALVSAIKAITNQIDIVVHAAGDIAYESTEVNSISTAYRLMEINFFAPLSITTSLLPVLKQSRSRILFINSTAVFNPGPNTSLYAASKAALHTYATSLRQSEKQLSICSVFLGRVDTPMQQRVLKWENRKKDSVSLLSTEVVAKSLVKLLDAESLPTEYTLKP